MARFDQSYNHTGPAFFIGTTLGLLAVLCGLWVCISLISGDPIISTVVAVIYGVLTGIGFGVYFVIQYLWPIAPPGCCKQCHYNLRGNPGCTACPECGQATA